MCLEHVGVVIMIILLLPFKGLWPCSFQMAFLYFILYVGIKHTKYHHFLAKKTDLLYKNY